jgi:ABC-2 type transport system ATP-binding protein
LKEENRRSGVTMLLTTHDMDDIEALCDRVMMIGHGKLLYDGDMAALKTRYAAHEGQDIDEIIAKMYGEMSL